MRAIHHSDLEPDVMTPLTDNASADEITAAAERQRQGAASAVARAERDRAEAEAIMSAAREEAARIIAEAEATARPVGGSAAGAEHAAGALTESARLLGIAAVAAAKAAASAARVKALEDEREALTAQGAELGTRRGTLAAERRDLEAQLAMARDTADIDAMTGLRNRIDSIRDVETALTAQQQQRVAPRLQQIGDGEMSPLWPQKELTEARRIAGMDRRSVREALNGAFPERPEAVADRARQHEQLLDRMRSEQLDERAAERDRAAWLARPQRVELQHDGRVTIRR